MQARSNEKTHTHRFRAYDPRQSNVLSSHVLCQTRAAVLPLWHALKKFLLYTRFPSGCASVLVGKLLQNIYRARAQMPSCFFQKQSRAEQNVVTALLPLESLHNPILEENCNTSILAACAVVSVLSIPIVTSIARVLEVCPRTAATLRRIRGE